MTNFKTDITGLGKYATKAKDIVGVNIKYMRRVLGLTQIELAQMCKVPEQQVAQWESGRRLPSLPNIRKLQKGMGCSWVDLLGE